MTPEQTADQAIDPAWFRRVLGQHPTGVTVITAVGTDGQPVGMAVGSFTSVSLHPPLVAFFPDQASTTWPKIQPAGSFCANVLGADHEWICRLFATKGIDRFAEIAWRPAGSGAPIIDAAVAWIDCDLAAVQEAGDHFIVTGRVRALGITSEGPPLVFHRGAYGSFTPLS
ncbi:flavin reductase family protein [Pseudofrankia asymbiotica]|uniref:Monooxygenase n=1 Tax=Pseudofrankia asymbiotica TaxID=1834516 RepID=A0A1V2I0C5_9ACTN|nr:flavin reductase family protein [Pseudofrankia asymbiotica]ONH22877.1 monooxygenase [Pseudofrankia asymbiotica]